MVKKNEAGSPGLPGRDGSRNASNTAEDEVPRTKETDHKYYFDKTTDTVSWLNLYSSTTETGLTKVAQNTMCMFGMKFEIRSLLGENQPSSLNLFHSTYA